MLKASPIVKKIIKDMKIDITNIKGSGPNGRIIMRDLPTKENKSNLNKNILTEMRKTIALRTTESFKNVPHFYLKIESNIDKLIALKDKINNSNVKYKISLNDLLIKALATAQKMNLKTCASWVDNKIIQYSQVDVSIAVALEDGLITPIIKNASNKGIIEISNEVKKLVIKAKNGKLKPEEYIGGTISITNLGMYGISEFGAIINEPQSSILAVGEAKKQPIIKKNKIIKATILKSTLSADHRVLDGAVAAKLLKDFNDIIENPFQIWLNSNDLRLN